MLHFDLSLLPPLDLEALIAPLKILGAPLVLTSIVLVHMSYVWRGNSRDCQQVIVVDDLTTSAAAEPVLGFTVVEASSTEFDARLRTATATNIALPALADEHSRRMVLRTKGSQRLKDGDVRSSVIVAEDLEVDGQCIFRRPVKVGGDLIVQGSAIFLAPVIVNGTLNCSGVAHFAGGIIVKEDSLVRGVLKIGAENELGWAVLRELLLGNKLLLNGVVVANRAVHWKEAA